MRTMREWTTGLLAMALVLGMAIVLPPSAHAAVIGLTFEGLQNLEPVCNFYNGGHAGTATLTNPQCDEKGSGPGPNFGIVFAETSQAVIKRDVVNDLSHGDFANEPSPVTALFFQPGVGAAMLDVPAGFNKGFSFFYSAPIFSGFVDVFDGLDGTGQSLLPAPLALSALGTACGRPDREFDCWDDAGVAFDGIAKSIVFGGSANRIAFDNVTFGSAIPCGAPGGPVCGSSNGNGNGNGQPPPPPVPAPATVILLGAGLALAALRIRGTAKSRSAKQQQRS
jgi:hypothetical protein